MRWKLKACPRCSGDIFIYRDKEGWYGQCLQCSFQRESRHLPELEKQLCSAGATTERALRIMAEPAVY